jgi:hypothetical protein
MNNFALFCVEWALYVVLFFRKEDKLKVFLQISLENIWNQKEQSD